MSATYEFLRLSEEDHSFLIEMLSDGLLVPNWNVHCMHDLVGNQITLALQDPTYTKWRHALIVKYERIPGISYQRLLVLHDPDHSLVSQFNRLKQLKAFL